MSLQSISLLANGSVFQKISRSYRLTIGSLLAILVFVAMLFLQSGSVSAATITVSNDCSIEDAIESVNNASNQGLCTSVGSYGSNDTIDIPAGTWVRTAGTSIDADVTITGSGAGQTIIDGDNSYYGLSCQANQDDGFDFAVSGLSIRNAGPSDSHSRGINTEDCNLFLSDIEIYDWTTNGDGVGVWSSSQQLRVEISNLHIHSGVGMGVNILQNGDGAMDGFIERTTINDLSSTEGLSVGIFVTSDGAIGSTDFIVRNVTIANSGDDALGIAVGASKSGNHSMDVQNTTIIGNEGQTFPAGGIIANAFTTAPDNVAIASITLQNVILADNSPGNCGINADDSSGGTATATITSLGNNIADDNSCGLTASGDQQNVASVSGTLGSLQDNGGFAPTISLLAGSPAIDAGATVLGVTTDQRGIARPQGSAYDIGAFELESESNGSNNPGDENDEDDSDGGVNGSGSNNDSGVGGDDEANDTLADTGTALILVASVATLLIALTYATLHRVKVRPYRISR